MRKLVSVKEITDVAPIPDADLIEVVEVDHGWKCVAKKGEFRVGDLCIYFEIDSFLPIIPEFDFLKKSSLKKMGDREGLRLKTVKLRGQISQGLALPIEALSGLLCGVRIEKGADLTEMLGVVKYEPPIPANIAGDVVGKMPSFIRKTDQERIQNLWEEYSEDPILKKMEWEATIKMDGTSMTVFVADKEKYGHKTYIGVCGRNYEYKETDKNTRWEVARRSIISGLQRFHEETGRSVALQGELMGPGIQKNREKLLKHEFFLYEVWDVDKQRYLTPKERAEVFEYFDEPVETVPFLENVVVFERFKSVGEILEYAEGPSLNAPVREGLVFKSKELVNGQTVSFKAISNKFLLKGGE